jgi:predicted nucleic acid-binding protein
MRFWDSSAIVPILCPQAATPAVLALRDADPSIGVWSWTPVECVSALRRLQREGTIGAPEVRLGRTRLDDLRSVWVEISDLRAVATRAERCLVAHSLTAADAGQLAAALIISERLGRPIQFVTLDRRLAEAARQEGFVVLGEGVVPSAHERSRGQRRTARGRSDAQPSAYR